MIRKKEVWLMGSASGLMLVAAAAAVVSAQWQHEALPFAALSVVLALTVIKSRWVVMDFMALRRRPRLAAALVAWPVFFAFAVLAKSGLAAAWG